MSDDLMAFLNARLDEDEAAANEIHRPRDCGSVDRDGSFDPDPIWCSCDYPARVLREVEAKRAIAGVMAETDPLADDSQWSGRAAVHDEAVRHLAAVYSGHPDYRPEWKP